MKAQWKAFQDLVARIERIAADRGATVQSPDWLRDIATGGRREVDVSIRQRMASAEVLIILECRRRKHKDDVTWIEQLATKKESVGAALAIAVSASGFSRHALALAERKGIALRRLSELSDQEIKLLVTPFFHVTPRIQIFAFGGLQFDDSTVLADPVEFPDTLKLALETGGDTPLFRTAGGEKVSLNALVTRTLSIGNPHGTRPFDDIPRDGSAVRKRLRLLVEPGALEIDTPNGPKRVSLVVLEVWFYLIEEFIPPDLAVQYRRIRSSDTPSTIRHSEYEVPHEHGATRVTLQVDDESAEPRIAAEIRDRSGRLRPAALEYLRGGRIKNGKFEEFFPKQAGN